MAGRDRASECPMDRAAIDRTCGWKKRRNISFAVTGILPMERSSFGAFGRWAYATDRSRRDRHGRTGMRKSSWVRSGGIPLTTWSSLGNDIFATCFNHTKATTTTSHAPISGQGRACTARGEGTRPRGFCASLGRPTPSIRSCLSFRQGQGLSVLYSEVRW